MSTSNRFLLLIILGIAIAVIGSHFLTIVLAISLMLVTYAMPLLIVLTLLIVGWKLVLSDGKQEERSQIEPDKSAKPDSHLDIERELNRLKHEIGQMHKKDKS